MTSVRQQSVVVFPGMAGTTFGGLGKFIVLDQYARRRLRVAEEVLGYPVRQRFRDSAADDDYSEAAQVVFLVASLALADRAERLLGMRPDFCVGMSFGQKAAAVYSGAVSFEDGIRMTAAVAGLEREYFRREHSDIVTHTVVRVPDDRLDELLAQLTARGHWLEVSGDLDRGFAMVSMSDTLLPEFKKTVTALGGYSMSTLRPPAHSTLFTGLRELVAREVVDRMDVVDPRIPVVADQDGAVVRTADAMRTMMLDNFDHPFDWRAVVGTLADAGVRTAYFTGSDALFFRLDSTVRSFTVVAVDPKSALRPAA